MHHLTKVKYIQKLNEEELRKGIKMSSSWHMKVINKLNYCNSIKTVHIFTSEDYP